MSEPSSLYRDIVELSTDGIWVFDLGARTLYANPAMARLLGVEQEEMRHLSVFDSLDAHGRIQLAEHLRVVRTHGPNPSEVEVLLVRRDGSSLWVLVSESLVGSPDGDDVAVLHRFSDFSDRRRVHDQLIASQADLHETQEIAKIGSWRWDPVTGVVTSSQGRAPVDALVDELPITTGRDFLDSILNDDRDRVTEALQRALAGDDEFQVDVQVAQADGQPVWIRLRGVVHRDAQGEVEFVAGTQQDVSEVIEAELALLDEVGQSVLMRAVASAANEAHTFLEVVRQAQALILSHDDWTRARGFFTTDTATWHGIPNPAGHELVDIDASPDDDPAVVAFELALARQALRNGRSAWSEDRDSFATVVSFGDQVCGVLTITSCVPLIRHDMVQSMVEAAAVQLARVAERETGQRAVADARDAALAASRQKSEFLATMSHEIRTPLNGFIGLNDLLQRTSLDPEQRRLSSGMQVASRALLSVINDVLDFSKIEAGELELELLDFEIRPLLSEVAQVLAGAASEQDVDLQVAWRDDVPELLRGDPARLSQVVVNLVANAIKFSPAGTVRVWAESRSVATDLGEDRVELRVSVQDTGIGIEPEQVPRLFDPFTQADASTSRRFGGTGLGLAISREIVLALGGQLTYAPNPGGGSIFTFTADLGRPVGDTSSVGTATRTPTAPASSRARRVLVVEDNAINQMVATGLLQSMGHVVDVADDGTAALERLTTTSYDAVLMDVQMPGLDGYATTRALRERERQAGGARLPVIAMTAAAIEGERDRCLAAGMDDFLTKPVDPTSLSLTLDHWWSTSARDRAPRPQEVTPVSTPAPPPSEEDPPTELDRERLDMLRDLDPGNTTYLDRAIGNFCVNSVAVVVTVTQQIAEGDSAAMKAAAHKIAGSALNLGVPRAAAAARAIEAIGDTGTCRGAAELLPELDAAMAAGRQALLDYQASYAGP